MDLLAPMFPFEFENQTLVSDAELTEQLDFQFDGMAAFAYALDPFRHMGCGKQSLPEYLA